MPANRLSMRKIKEVLRLKWANNLSDRKIAQSCHISSQLRLAVYSDHMCTVFMRWSSVSMHLIVSFIGNLLIVSMGCFFEWTLYYCSGNKSGDLVDLYDVRALSEPNLQFEGWPAKSEHTVRLQLLPTIDQNDNLDQFDHALPTKTFQSKK